MGERLKGKVALVTSAGQGIGRATALAMERGDLDIPSKVSAVSLSLPVGPWWR